MLCPIKCSFHKQNGLYWRMKTKKDSDFFSGVIGSNLCLDTENIDLLRFTKTVQANSRIFTD